MEIEFHPDWYFRGNRIDRRVTEGFEAPRPLTHDLIVSVAESFDAKVDHSDQPLRKRDLLRKTNPQRADGQVTEIDARPVMRLRSRFSVLLYPSSLERMYWRHP